MKILLYGNFRGADRTLYSKLGKSNIHRVVDNKNFLDAVSKKKFDYLVLHRLLFSGIEEYLAASINIAQSDCEIKVRKFPGSADIFVNEECVVFDFHSPLK